MSSDSCQNAGEPISYSVSCLMRDVKWIEKVKT